MSLYEYINSMKEDEMICLVDPRHSEEKTTQNQERYVEAIAYGYPSSGITGIFGDWLYMEVNTVEIVHSSSIGGIHIIILK